MFSQRTTRRALVILGTASVIAALLLLDVVGGIGYTVALAALGLLAAAGAAFIAARGGVRVAWWRAGRLDALDLAVILGLYLAVVGGFLLAFTVFTTQNVVGLFLSFGAAMLIGSVGPIGYTVLLRRRSLASLGIGLGSWRRTLALAVVFAAVQFVLTLARLDYPALATWLPLLVMALTVGLFEAIFFRGFIQNRLEAAFGIVPAVGLAAGLYGLYHVGYGMPISEIGFLTGLGVVYAVAFRLAGSILVLWPLLTPLGSLFSQVQAGDIVLPMESILGFADVLGLMVAAIWFARRLERRRTKPRTIRPVRSAELAAPGGG